MSRYLIRWCGSRGAPTCAGALTFLLALVLVASGCSLLKAGSVATPEPIRSLVDAGPIEMAGSGFAVSLPDGWTAEIADPDPDVFEAEPGEAWWALEASAPYGFMVCTIAVGVTDIPGNRGGTVVRGTGTTPYWGPSRPWQLRVPRPDVPNSVFMNDMWVRPQGRDERFQHDVIYSLDCAANEARVWNYTDFFEQIRGSFGYLPEEG